MKRELTDCDGIDLRHVANAIDRGVEIERMEIVKQAAADLGPLLTLGRSSKGYVFEAGNRRPGFSNIETLVKLRSNADERTLAELGDAALHPDRRTHTLKDRPRTIAVGFGFTRCQNCPRTRKPRCLWNRRRPTL